MDAPHLTIDPGFWDQTANSALLNPRTPNASGLRRVLERAADKAGLRNHVIFATSGSTGVPKFACLSRGALLASAAAVNIHLRAMPGDHWFCALPLFHVGGVGVRARAHLLGCGVSTLDGRWNARGFRDQLAASGATLSAMVPTQVHDLVAGRLRCPAGVRAILVGGGALERSLHKQALQLGWPLLVTFGMTEAASQIATQTMGEIGDLNAAEELTVLPVWEARSSTRGVLEIRGNALFSGYLQPSQADADPGIGFSLVRPFSRDGWFSTSDRVRLFDAEDGDGIRLAPVRRTDEMVKILGENVDVGAIQAAVDPVGATVIIVAMPDPRAGSRLVAAIETDCADAAEHLANVEMLVRSHNATVAPPERVCSIAAVPVIPRSELGKVAKHQLVSILENLKYF